MANPPKPHLSLREIMKDFKYDTGEEVEDKPRPIRSKTLGALFASAQDLRSLNLEKEIQDGTSPRGVLDACKHGIGSDKGSPAYYSHCTASKPHSHWRRVLKQWKRKSIKRLYTFPQAVSKWSGRKGKEVSNAHDDLATKIDANYCNFKACWKIFSLDELEIATNNFSQENLIGKGGFAEVYEGCLQDGELVAVKRLINGTQEEQIDGFLSELGIIAHIDHPNTAKLIGYGVEETLCLVLQLSSLGSLGSLLRGEKEKLDWDIRYKIGLGIADGLVYLHDHCQRRIIHRDIKSDNILLTENFEAQICDFGIAFWLPRQCSHRTMMRYEGTFGYIAPEYLMHGLVDEKTDVFAFGVVLLEIIAGRQALDESQQSIVMWAKSLLAEKDHKALIDPCIEDAYNEEELKRMVLTASMCVEASQILRPRMSQAAQLLRGSKDNTKSGCSMQRTFSEELLDAKEYNSTKCLNDLSQHRQVAFSSTGLDPSPRGQVQESQSPPSSSRRRSSLVINDNVADKSYGASRQDISFELSQPW